MNGAVTKRSVDALTPGTTLWDTQVSGFGCRCRSGGRKTYVFKYRLHGRKHLFTIGTHGSPWTPDRARAKALGLAGKVAEGHSPAQERKDDRGVPTVALLAERFLGEHADLKTKPRTASDTRRLFQRLILPVIGRVRLDALGRADVARLHHELRATPYQANRVLSALSKMLNWAERHGLRPDGSNPCRHVERFKERSRERFLSEVELARLGEVLSKAEGEAGSPQVGQNGRGPSGRRVGPMAVAAIRLLIFTGARMSEVLTLRWADVDLARGQARLPDSKTGPKTIYLNPPALELLASLPRVEGNPFVLPGGRDGWHLADLEAPWRVLRERAGLADVRLHDLRHSFAATAAGIGQSLLIIGRLLGHTQPQTTAKYAHLAADPMRQAADAVGARLADALRRSTPDKIGGVG